MTHSMMFDGTVAGEERLTPPGEVWSRLVRGLLSFLRAELGTGGGQPPGDDDEADEPAISQAATELRGLEQAYDAQHFRPTYEPLLKPDPEPTQPPDEPDPPPSGYGEIETDEKLERAWPTLLVALLIRRLFPDGFPSPSRPKAG